MQASHTGLLFDVPAIPPPAKQIKEKAPRTKRDYRRYYLHRKIKGHCNLNPRLHIIHIPFGQWDKMETKIIQYMGALRDQYGYSIQSKIPQ